MSIGISIAPGFITEKRRLARLLEKAAAIAATLKVNVKGYPLAEQLTESRQAIEEIIKNDIERE